MANKLIYRNGWAYFIIRVPKDVKKYDSRRHVKIALKTKDPTQAAIQAAVHHDALKKYWAELIKTKKVHGADARWHDAVTLARANRFLYRPIEELVQHAPVEEIIARLLALEKKGVEPRLAGALLGGAGKPVLRYSGLLEAYYDLTKDRLMKKSEDQKRKWRNPRIKAVNNLQGVIGDISIEDTAPRHMLDFRKWWLDRIVAEELAPASANKDFTHLKDVLRTVCAHYEIKLNFPALFEDVTFEVVENSRKPFPADFIKKTLLKKGALDDLHPECRAVVYMMIETGAGPTELVGMEPGEDILLEAKIPYIWIRPNKIRSLKTDARPRQIPLVGAALIGARLVKNGFVHYTNGDGISANTNKYFRERGWQLSKDHTLYSLRHSFKDRLRAIDAADSLMDELMGHSPKGEKYGDGYTLKKKKEWLDKIAFKV